MNPQLVVPKKESHFFTASLVLFMGLLLNQSSVLFGMNLSFADIFLLLLFVVWILQGEWKIPVIPILLFATFSVFLLLNSTFLTPQLNTLPIDYSGILKDYLKLFVMFLYFLFGWHIRTTRWLHLLMVSFLAGAVIIGAVGFLLSFFTVPILSDIMMFAGVRLKGLMNDPNYFSVVQCAAFICAIRFFHGRVLWKRAFQLILVLSILSSGSKTGIVTLLAVLFYAGFHSFQMEEKDQKAVTKKMMKLVAGSLSAMVLLSAAERLLLSISRVLPIFERVALLFRDFSGSVTSGGSGRESVWATAIHLTKKAPWVGVGVGNYGPLAQRFSGDPNVAHNTFLQLSAEWGIPLTVCLVAFLIFLLAEKPRSIGKEPQTVPLFLKEVLVVFLISSMAISFNHSRLFWLFLGMAAGRFVVETKVKKEETEWILHLDSQSGSHS